MGLVGTIIADLKQKALCRYGNGGRGATLRAFFADGTAAMIFYRLMQWSRHFHLPPLEAIFQKVNSRCCGCVIGRGAEFGPGLAMIHSSGIVIDGAVRGGSNVRLYQQVRLGGDRSGAPTLGDHILVAPGAKVIGAIRVGDGARIGVNAVVTQSVPAGAMAVGDPATVVPAAGDDQFRNEFPDETVARSAVFDQFATRN